MNTKLANNTIDEYATWKISRHLNFKLHIARYTQGLILLFTRTPR